jgi:pyruvate dehydrogenase E1 component alpha subunit
LQDALLGEELLSPQQLERLESRDKEVVEEAVRFARESPWPAPEDALEDVMTL